MPVFLYAGSSHKSGNRLADYLGIPSAKDYKDRWGRQRFLIRYGSRKSIPYTPSVRTVNRKWALDRQSDRLDQLRLLRSAGVSVPPFQTEPFQRGPFLARQNGGMQGRGIEVCHEPPDNPEDYDFYSMLIDKHRQFRVHVVGGETRTRELIPTEEGDREQAVWNYDAGFTFRIPEDIPPKVIPTAFAAVKALNLEFGAVDIGYTETAPGMPGHVDVFEVNTAPGLDDRTLEWYADQLRRQYLWPELDFMPRWSNADRSEG